MKKLIFSFFLCGATMFPAFSQTYQELSERAVAATEQDSLSLAEKYIEQALKMEPANPHNALLFSNLGTIQRWQHRYEQALDSYTLALNIAPRAIPALMNRAALYLELGKDDLARIDYSLVLDIESDNQEALLMRAYIYMRQRNYNFAKSDYERLLKLAPPELQWPPWVGHVGAEGRQIRSRALDTECHDCRKRRRSYPADYPAICRTLRSTCGCRAGYETCGPGHDGLGRSHQAGCFADRSLLDTGANLPFSKEKGVGKT